MSMRTVLVRKTTNAAITIVIILILNFILFRLMPGDPARLFLSGSHSTSEDIVARQREISASTTRP